MHSHLAPLSLLLFPQWEAVENKPGFIAYSAAAFSAIWLSSTVINALNGLPLVSPPTAPTPPSGFCLLPSAFCPLLTTNSPSFLKTDPQGV